MSNKLKTAIAFVKNIRTTGAITQTSKKTEQEITSQITKKTKFVVEFGMGHGNITKVILSKLPKDAKVFAFEINPEFCELVRADINDPRLKVVNDSAENLKKYIGDEEVDSFVSSMPLTMFPSTLVHTIMDICVGCLSEDGHFSQVLYNKKSQSKFADYYNYIEVNGNVSLPPQYIYHCSEPKKRQ